MDNATVHDYSNQLSTYQKPDYFNLPKKITPLGEKAFIFSPRLMRWAAYDQYGYKVANGRANGGADFCDDINEPCRTPVGDFRVTRMRGADCKSNQFPVDEGGGAPMPFCTFFKGGAAIHGSPYLANANTSHGCIRVKTAAAEWLQRNFLLKGTRVITLPY